MLDNPRIKRVLKRYRKGEDIPNSSMDVSRLGDDELLRACRCFGEDSLAAPRELDNDALAYLSHRMGIEFDCCEFDYFLHPYVRSEFVSEYFADLPEGSKITPEGGPASNIPIPEGMRWHAVRPKDGEERYEAW